MELTYEQLKTFCEGEYLLSNFVDLSSMEEQACYFSCDLTYVYTIDTLKLAISNYRNRGVSARVFFEEYIRIILFGIPNLIGFEGSIVRYCSNRWKHQHLWYLMDTLQEYTLPTNPEQLLGYVFRKMLSEYLGIDWERPYDKHILIDYSFEDDMFDDVFGCEEEENESEDEINEENHKGANSNNDIRLLEIFEGVQTVIQIFQDNYVKEDIKDWNITEYQATNFAHKYFFTDWFDLAKRPERERTLLVKCLDIAIDSMDEYSEIATELCIMKAFLLWGMIPGLYDRDLDESARLLDRVYKCTSEERDLISSTKGLILLEMLYLVDMDSVLEQYNGCERAYVGSVFEKDNEMDSELECFLPGYTWDHAKYGGAYAACKNLLKPLYEKYKKQYEEGDYNGPFVEATFAMILAERCNERPGSKDDIDSYYCELKEALNKRKEKGPAWHRIMDMFLLVSIDDLLYAFY